MDFLKIASRVVSQFGSRVAGNEMTNPSDTVKVWVNEETGLFKVEYKGEISSAIMPENPDEGNPEDINGDINIVQAAVQAWGGEPYFEMSADEFAAASGGYWKP